MRLVILILIVWLGIPAMAGLIGVVWLGANFWVGAGLGIFSIAVNALVIEWEDRQPGGWSE